LNPQQISGACGRLMCCLRHEHDFYVQSRRRFPKEGKVLVTARGEERVLACDIFREQVTLRGPEGETRVVPLAALRAEVVQADGAWLQAGAVSEGAAVASVPPAAAAALPVPPSPAPYADDPGDPDAASAASASDTDTDTDTATDDADAEADGVDAPDDATGDEASGAADPEARRKRRRGRRGGRRVRAAEQRRAATDDPPPRPDPS
ncbi:MAG: hypothetical protein RLZ32_2461, partial [Gemmatimonadota bacterium]